MPKIKKPIKSVSHKELFEASGLGLFDYARIMGVSDNTVYRYNATPCIVSNDTYTQLAMLHAGCHPFYTLIKR